MLRRLLTALHRRGLVPRMSESEREALEAGDVWVEGALFAGRPDFRRLLAEPYPELTAAERDFLDGPVEEVCRRTDPEAVRRRGTLPDAVWELLREHRFFGLGLPRAYGGHAFSALAQSTVFGKLASRSPALSTVVLIPNSVGPGELLVAVGTEEQRRHYLPRLARGDEIPCFALTEPEAGSDAASLTSRGVLFRDGAGELAIRLDFDKRYITLAPIATLIGLAFRLHDPEGLLGRGEEVGITVALVGADLPGIDIGRRHDPMGIPFPNGPIRGRGVVVPARQILGGVEQAGRGWRMLMEALAGGRAVSLPAQATAGAKHVARVAGAYSVVRRQFGVPIGRFEGVEEPLARIAGTAYLMEAARVFTCGAVDRGRRPAMASALVKYTSTELARRCFTDGMDVLGGAALCRGPRNLMADGYTGAAIGITVEGANILTRTLIVFGQGVLRCHPYARRLLDAVRDADPRAFRGALWGSLRHFLGSALRCVLLGLSRGRLARALPGPTARYARRLAWASARFALCADLALGAYGSRLKSRGKLAGRFADALSWMYLGLATVRRYEAEGRRPEDLPLMRWGLETALARIQTALEGILRSFDLPLLGALLRGPVLLWVRLNRLGGPPPDRLGSAAARTLQRPGAQRSRLIAGLYQPGEDHALATLERAFGLAVEAEPLLARLRQAERSGRLAAGAPEDRFAAAVAAGILTPAEVELVRRAEAARREAIEVDSFPAGRVPEPAAPSPAGEPVAAMP